MKKLRATAKPKAANNPAFKPGQLVPRTGIYSVEHRPHRLMHTATLTANALFPRCKQCGDAVRFTLLRVVQDGQVVPFRTTALLEAYPEEIDYFPKAG
jgi:hypothetical protein